MEFLLEWITNVILFLLLATVIDLLIPDTSIQKYVKMVTGLLLITIIITPLLQLLSTDIDQIFSSMSTKSEFQEEMLENEIEMKKKEIQASHRAYILEQTAVQMKEDVEEELIETYGYMIQDIEIFLTEDTVTGVEVMVTKYHEDGVTVPVVKSISINTSQPMKKNNKSVAEQDISKHLSDAWEIDSELINVQMEGGE
ncbi:stage III sporulation protein AF [Cytobacillus sp. IB215665]|uniref:stage III sporulation protein AF n=1 Tax=Cytobacillus sp. IB215665 TaxID=3097357 RepID=UPI002A0CEDAD|nr:stage III sporulation protein AF [Cytobacillus sp. IB215665]MDX8364281.1 stage III sporulation protein AF [Cytobacillus sp. IB215665]